MSVRPQPNPFTLRMTWYYIVSKTMSYATFVTLCLLTKLLWKTISGGNIPSHCHQRYNPVATSSPNPGRRTRIRAGGNEPGRPTQNTTRPANPGDPGERSPHVRGPTGKYICDLCKKSFGTLANFRLHFNVHRKVLCKILFQKNSSMSAAWRNT